MYQNNMYQMRKMKLFAGLFFALCLCAMTACVWASDGSVGKRIYDEAQLFTASEADELQALAEEKIAESYMDIVVVTTENTGGKSAMAYADDFYDYNGFGYDGNTGVLLLIDMGEREIWITTTGEAESYFTDARISALVETVATSLSNGDYAEGARQFIEDSASYMNNTSQSSAWSRQTETWLSRAKEYVWACLFAGFLIGGIVVLVMYQMQRHMGRANAHTYLKDDRYSVDDKSDVFTHTTTVRRRIETDSGGHSSSHRSGHSSSHGGGHVSGSGTHHGGGGGRF